jgi:hypothetical protein
VNHLVPHLGDEPEVAVRAQRSAEYCRASCDEEAALDRAVRWVQAHEVVPGSRPDVAADIDDQPNRIDGSAAELVFAELAVRVASADQVARTHREPDTAVGVHDDAARQ